MSKKLTQEIAENNVQKYNVTLLEKYKGNCLKYLFQCAEPYCKKTFIATYYHVSQGHSIYCLDHGTKYKAIAHQGSKNYNYKGSKDIPGIIFTRIKQRAKIKNKSLEININDIQDQYDRQNKRCAYTNIKVYFHPKKGKYHSIASTASVDRIDNNQGYVKHNIQIVHKNINQIKWILSEDKFFKLCCLVTNHICKVEYGRGCMIINHGNTWKGCGNLSSSKFSNIKYESKKREIIFDISIEDMWKQFIKQRGYCTLTGKDLTWDIHRNNKTTRGTSSLDRIDSNQPYIKNNIHWVHKDINMMKWNFSIEDFKYWCKLVNETRKKK